VALSQKVKEDQVEVTIMYEDLSEDQIIARISEPATSAFQVAHTEGYKAEITKRLLLSIRGLNESINKLNNSTEHYSKILILLTAILALFTLVQLYFILVN